MWCNQIFSLINEGKIQNIIVADNYTIANQIAQLQYGEEAIAVDTTQYPVSIDFTYEDGAFKDLKGNVVHRNPTEEERLAALTKRLEEADAESVDTDFRLCSLELGMQ